MKHEDLFGGPEGEATRWRNDSTRRTQHQREVTAARLRAHGRRLQMFMPLALLGLALLFIAITSDSINPWLQCARTVIGVVLVLPLLVEMMLHD